MNRKVALIILAILSIVSIIGSRYALIQTSSANQTDDELPIGLALSSEIDDLLAHRLERIHELIISFKLNRTEQHDAKLRFILEYHEMILNRTREWKEQFRNLVQKSENGTISRAEFKMERERLRHRLLEMNRTFLHLDRELQEALKWWKGNDSNLGQLISSINKDVAQQIRDLYANLYEKQH